jgi:hypothetical protein
MQDGVDRAGEPGEVVGDLPHRHAAAVDEDDDGVEGDTDEGEHEARVRPVAPQGVQEERVRDAEQRHAQRLDKVDARAEEDLGPEPDDDRQEQEGEQLQADVGQSLELAPEHQAEHEPEHDPADQHRLILRCARGPVRGR